MTMADFWRFYRVISRRRWLVAAVVGCTMLVVAVGVLVMPRYYRATALVMPSDQALQRPVVAGSVGAPADRGYDPQAREERLANLIYLAQSQAVVARAAEALKLSEPPKRLARRITVDTLPRTALLRIVALDRDPQQSIGIANSVAHVFADFYRELSHREAVDTRVFLERELTSAERDLQRAQEELARFRAAGDVAGLERDPAEPVITPLERDRDTTEAQLRETAARLAAARSQLERERPTVVSEEGTTDNPAVTKLRIDLLDLESKLAAELAVHTEKHPAVIALRAQIDDLRRRLATDMERVIKHTTISRNPIHDILAAQVADLESQKAALQARLGATTEIASRERGRVAEASSRGVRLAALTREYRITEETYARLRGAVDQARIDEKVTNDAGAIQIVDLARNAEGPVTRGPSPWQLLALGFVLSLAVAFGLALAFDVLDDRVKTVDDVMRLLNLPVTGIIPAIEGVRAHELPLITRALPSSAFAEAYRFLRTDLLFTCEDQPLQTLCVVTPKPGQGGTTTIANLAITLAEADRRVILVDADLRRPSLHRIFDLPNEVGLTSVLGSGTALSDALQSTGIPNLLLLAAGPPAHNPSNLISSNRMRALMRELRERCDFVLLDTPSAIAFSDAAIIASMTDGALMVVRARQPLRGSQLQVTSLLNKARANVIGVVLNDAAPEDVDTCYFYSHYYSTALPGSETPAPALPGPGSHPVVDSAPPALETEPFGRLRAGSAHEEATTENAAPATSGAGEAPAVGQIEEAASWDALRQASALDMAADAAERRVRRRWLSRALSALLVAGLGYLAAGAMGYAPLPRLGEQRQAAATVAAAPARVELVADVKTPTLARITADGRVLYDGVLVPGRNQWEAGDRITVWVERPEAVDFEQDGKPIGALGKAGDGPAERTFVAAE